MSVCSAMDARRKMKLLREISREHIIGHRSGTALRHRENRSCTNDRGHIAVL